MECLNIVVKGEPFHIDSSNDIPEINFTPANGNQVQSTNDETVPLIHRSFKANLNQHLSLLREEELFSDVTLACDGKFFSAHKFMLAMCSSYFKEMFMYNTCQHPIVFMKDVLSSDMEALLNFVYSGVAHVPLSNLFSILKTAEGLQIRGLEVIDKRAEDNTLDGTSGLNEAESNDPDEIIDPSISFKQELIETDNDHSPIPISVDPFVPTLDEDNKDASIIDTASDPLFLRNSLSMESSKYDPAQLLLSERNKSEKVVILDTSGKVAINEDIYSGFCRLNPNRYINDLLRYFFPTEVLASSSLTGKHCFANKKGVFSNKSPLDPFLTKVITDDAIRNFPAVTEIQIRKAIRTKLNTESHLFKLNTASRLKRNLIRIGKHGRIFRGKSRKYRPTISRIRPSVVTSDTETHIPCMGPIEVPDIRLEKVSNREAEGLSRRSVRLRKLDFPSYCGLTSPSSQHEPSSLLNHSLEISKLFTTPLAPVTASSVSTGDEATYHKLSPELQIPQGLGFLNKNIPHKLGRDRPCRSPTSFSNVEVSIEKSDLKNSPGFNKPLLTPDVTVEKALPKISVGTAKQNEMIVS